MCVCCYLLLFYAQSCLCFIVYWCFLFVLCSSYSFFVFLFFFFFKQKTAYEMRISDWSSDVCSSDLARLKRARHVDIIEATEARRHEQNLSTAVAQDVADLRLAIDWDDGIADKAADTTSQVDYLGFEPVGKLEAYHIARN